MALKDKYLTIAQAAKELGVTRQTISRWIKKGHVPAEKVGRVVLISKDSLNKYQQFKLSEEAAEYIVKMYENYLTEYFRKKGKISGNIRIELGGDEQLTEEEKVEVNKYLLPLFEDFLKGFTKKLRNLEGVKTKK